MINDPIYALDDDGLVHELDVDETMLCIVYISYTDLELTVLRALTDLAKS